MKEAGLFSINWNDVIKGLVMAVLTPVVFIVQQTLEKGTLVFNWQSIGMAAVAGGVGYIIKNFFTPAAPVKEVTKTEDGTITKTVVSTDQVNVVVDKK